MALKDVDAMGWENQKVEADLHCHTNRSDGTSSPRELVRKAGSLGLAAIGITDHDTIKGWEEAERAGEDYGVEILRGVELSADWRGTEVHMLGYEMEKENTVLVQKLAELGEDRRERLVKILARLKGLGLEVPRSQVEAYAQGDSVGRPHIAQAMVARGYVKTVQEAFSRFLEAGAPAYVPRQKLTPEGAIKLIRQAGGVVVLAHPGIYKVDAGIAMWVKDGLQGIEAIHSEHSKEDTARYIHLAAKYRLLVTGGSDFHGEEIKPEAELGKWGVGMDVVRQIRELAGK